MDHILPSHLKSILHSKRSNIYYLEYCRVMQKNERVLYLMENKNENKYWNIPIANTTVILLGIGTSITQAAVRMLSKAGVIIGFTGNGGSPLLSGTEIEWFTPQSEYRPTQYMQYWMKFWFNENERLKRAILLQIERINLIKNIWSNDKDLISNNFIYDTSLELELDKYISQIYQTNKINDLLLLEASLTRKLYAYCAKLFNIKNFRRDHDNGDLINRFLSHGNYLCYGIAATTLWVLGINYSFALMHGKTRRGALVFDIADIVKDAIVLPWAFIYGLKQEDNNNFRMQILQKFVEKKALNIMFTQVKKIALLDYR